MCSSWKGCGELSVAPKRDVSRAVDGGGAQVRSCPTLPGGGLCGPWEERGLRHAWAPRGREEAASGGTAVGSVLLNRAKSEVLASARAVPLREGCSPAFSARPTPGPDRHPHSCHSWSAAHEFPIPAPGLCCEESVCRRRNSARSAASTPVPHRHLLG